MPDANTHKRLVLIGGAEDKQDACMILNEFVRLAGGPQARIILATVATASPQTVGTEYTDVFRRLGCATVQTLDVTSRDDANAPRAADMIGEATGVFFTGGDQLQLTSQLGSTPLCNHIQAFYYERGGVIAGTSAGASAMCETMLVSGNGDETHKIGDTLRMPPGLGFVKDMIIDQHFAERGRIGRLLAAVVQNPRLLGVGIDEDTAIVVEGEECFRVLGSGAVYVIDGRGVTKTNISEKDPDRTLSIFDARLHLLSQGSTFDLKSRRPTYHAAETAQERGEYCAPGTRGGCEIRW